MKYNENDVVLHVDCSCYSPEHTLRFTMWDWPDGGPHEMSLVAALVEHKWYKRIWNAIKYVWGFGESHPYSETLITVDDAVLIKELMEKYIYETAQRAKFPQPPKTPPVRIVKEGKI